MYCKRTFVLKQSKLNLSRNKIKIIIYCIYITGMRTSYLLNLVIDKKNFKLW